MLIVFTVGDSIRSPLKAWVNLLEKGEKDMVRDSIRKIDGTSGMECTYYFIQVIGEAFEKCQCSEEAYKLASRIYFETRPMPADY